MHKGTYEASSITSCVDKSNASHSATRDASVSWDVGVVCSPGCILEGGEEEEEEVEMEVEGRALFGVRGRGSAGGGCADGTFVLDEDEGEDDLMGESRENSRTMSSSSESGKSSSCSFSSSSSTSSSFVKEEISGEACGGGGAGAGARGPICVSSSVKSRSCVQMKASIVAVSGSAAGGWRGGRGVGGRVVV